MRRAANVFLLALVLASTAGAALAAGVFNVGLNESRRVVLRGMAANVIVGDPTVADVAMVDAHNLILLGRGYGATDVVVLDHAGRTLFDSRVTVNAPETGRVTIHRGAQASEFSCSPRCQVLGTKDGSSAVGAVAGAGASGQPTPGPSATPVAVPGV